MVLVSIRDRLNLLAKTLEEVQQGKVIFDPKKAKFGLTKFDQLFSVDTDEQIKGYPCVAYNHISDPIRFGVKVNPLEKDFDIKEHPIYIEIQLIREFTECVLKGYTPHVTFYFCDMNVKNTTSALTKFPLKGLRDRIYTTSSVLISEFVPGGSLEDYINMLDPSVDQWRFIIFSVAWTLAVLQDRYRFMHNDCHYGNVLIDNSIDPDDKSYVGYRMFLPQGQSFTFCVPNCGIIPKLWDFEFSNVFRRIKLPANKFTGHDDSMPVDFNPYYDLHLFLTSLLELPLPDEVEEFILSIYPPELIPLADDGSSDSTESLSSRSCEASDEEDEPEELRFEDMYYYTDESDEESLAAGQGPPSEGGKSSRKSKNSEASRRKTSRSARSSVFTHKHNRRRTEFLDGDRMINGAQSKFKNLPTPLTLLTHPFFKEYRRPVKRSRSFQPDILLFSYQIDSPMSELM